ncbi:hypothetical protein JTE90_015797 [Oedothorax gibbosus]|uniref:Uncharacterized protein n=1 Tax=Oedothorax gibbosus TaxID=931172 RepID=A0AAV6U9S9_9ARAC|nr:hypothetical protein JTE90_015797 [Oedothorax gibbosus]
MRGSNDNVEPFNNTAENKLPPNRIGQAFKFVVFVCCLIGFSYQVIEFYLHFLTYPMASNFELNERESFVLPALTFCNVNPVQRSKYCEKYPTRCYVPPEEEFCHAYPLSCKGNNATNLQIPMKKYLSDRPKPENRLTVSDIIELSQNSTEMDAINKYPGHGSEANSTSNFTRVYFTRSNKELFLCYTTNARYTNTPDPPDKKFDEDSATTFAYFALDVQPEEYFQYHEKHQFRFVMHSPYSTTNPYVIGMPLRPGIAYKIHVLLREIELLPYPYITNCFDYHKSWKENGKPAPRSREMCVNNCQRRFNKECYRCEKDLTFYLESDKICHNLGDLPCDAYRPIQEIEKDLKKCKKLCKPDCKSYVYEYTDTVEQISETMLEEQNLILVAIIADDPEVHSFMYLPQYQTLWIGN